MTGMNQNDLPLRDIHLPEPVSWWPPAPGWWLLLAAACVFIAALIWWQRRSLAIWNSPATIARIELEKLQAAWNKDRDAQQLLRDISIWLRRASMSFTSRREVASLTGTQWQQQLADMAGEVIFDDADSKLLSEASYRSSLPAGTVIDGDQLLALCERWITATTHRLKRK